jgi:Leucine-rich repeat (LRR) protein
MKKLKRLDLSNNPITNAGLEHLKGLTELKRLFLYANHGITDAGLKHLSGMKQLEHLDLYATKVTDNGANDLQKELPKTRISR